MEAMASRFQGRSRGSAAAAGPASGTPPLGTVTLKSLRQREALLSLALSAGRFAVWEWDVPSGRVVYAVFEGYHARLFGHPTYPTFVEVRAEDWNRSSHPDDADMQEVTRRAVEGPRDTFTTLYRRQSPSGSPWEWVETHGRVVSRNRAGKALRIVGTVGRATEREREEADRRQRETDLAQAIRLSSIAEVASALGHELNQPLAAAMADVESAQRLLAAGASGRTRATDALNRALSCMERAAAIVRQHRRAIRPIPDGPQRVDVASSASQIVAMFDADARRSGITLAAMAPRAACVVQGNRTQIEQIIANLVRNALESVATVRTGERQVTVVTKRTKTHVQVRCVDTGPGVNADAVASLFTPYFTTKRKGTGLGLSLSRSLAEAHHGRLALESGRAGGTIFLLELPRSISRARR